MRHAHDTPTTFTDSRRSSAGLAVTIAIHAGIAALALAGLGIATTAPKRLPDPIIARPIPDPVVVPPVAAPRRIEQPIRIDVPEPVVNIATLPPIGFDDPVLPDPGPLVTGLALPPLGGDGADKPPPGPTTPARFDPRHAGTAQPPYPAAARRLDEAGDVVIHVRIGRDGRVLAATLAQSSGSPRLDAAALAHALRAWRFTPALAGGRPVEAERDITVRFRLDAAG